MRNVYIVIGANYGDEGKGLATDYLSKEVEAKAVIKFCGGAQAGHTVQLDNGTRHVFHHFGSGTFSNIPTYLSRHFISNPFLFLKEHAILQTLTNSIAVAVSPHSLITTPYDVLINHIIEKKRRKNLTAHGSCGAGINETVNRSRFNDYRLDISTIQSKDRRKILTKIRDTYFPERLRELDISIGEIIEMFPEEYKIWTSLPLISNFCSDCDRFLEKIQVVDDYTYLSEIPGNIVFEGAQGLKLDKDYGNFPYVTRSNTGCINPIDLLHGIRAISINLVYVSRPYITRHGEGPLRYELKENTFDPDKTNTYNDWQGRFKYAMLHIDDLVDAITYDHRIAYHHYVLSTKNLFFTCCDHIVGKPVRCVADNMIMELTAKEIINILDKRIGFAHIWQSFGPTKSKIEKYL
jgi:adenylosuccinate synthase